MTSKSNNISGCNSWARYFTLQERRKKPNDSASYTNSNLNYNDEHPQIRLRVLCRRRHPQIVLLPRYLNYYMSPNPLHLCGPMWHARQRRQKKAFDASKRSKRTSAITHGEVGYSVPQFFIVNVEHVNCHMAKAWISNWSDDKHRIFRNYRRADGYQFLCSPLRNARFHRPGNKRRSSNIKLAQINSHVHW